MARARIDTGTSDTQTITTASSRHTIKSASSYAGAHGGLIIINELSARVSFRLLQSDAGAATLADPSVPPNGHMQVYLPQNTTHVAFIAAAGSGSVSWYPFEEIGG